MSLQQQFEHLDQLSRIRALTHEESAKLEKLMRRLGMITK